MCLKCPYIVNDADIVYTSLFQMYIFRLMRNFRSTWFLPVSMSRHKRKKLIFFMANLGRRSIYGGSTIQHFLLAAPILVVFLIRLSHYLETSRTMRRGLVRLEPGSYGKVVYVQKRYCWGFQPFQVALSMTSYTKLSMKEILLYAVQTLTTLGSWFPSFQWYSWFCSQFYRPAQCYSRVFGSKLEVGSLRSFRHGIRHIDNLPVFVMPTQRMKNNLHNYYWSIV